MSKIRRIEIRPSSQPGLAQIVMIDWDGEESPVGGPGWRHDARCSAQWIASGLNNCRVVDLMEDDVKAYATVETGPQGRMVARYTP